ncbi:class I mannose-6-phosphate isomerase [Streptomyces sp. NPDC049040]|uniref:class I mannose-6-phosphate isomerase n=1 Tax=Streptomyces sp. NPDC049040 TaxID=3365593 RepID=UPI00371A71E2
MQDLTPTHYDAHPCYPPRGGTVGKGWDAAVASLPDGPAVLAVDGPAVLEWARAVAALTRALAGRGVYSELFDVRDHFAGWEQVLSRTTSAALADDPHFESLAQGTLADLFDELPGLRAPVDGITVVYGPGAALVEHDVLWYADLPKRYAEAAVIGRRAANLAQPETEGPGTTKRLFYVDWPLLDRHRDAVAERIDLWLDTQDPAEPAVLDGATLRDTLAGLAGRPFRTRPTFNTTSWGGHWGQRELGFNPAATNTALGYELIAPESGILIGAEDGPCVEIPFQLAVALHPREILGPPVHDVFGTSFPIRFDYLDTVDGGNLSVHCHPRSDYMRDVFGWPYTQHETYYMMVGGKDSDVFLGLRDGVDVDAFQRAAHDAAHHGQPFDITTHVQTFPATAHQLFLIPAGTPHGSGAGNVVLEVSATPYLYSLRFYDWLRRDAGGNQRPVHVDHAFRNLDTERTGKAVERDLVQEPAPLRGGSGWSEETIGALPEMFFEVRRVVLDPGSVGEDDTEGRFHVLNVVEGDGVRIQPAGSPRDAHTLAYAETLVVPASVGAYTLHPIGRNPVRIVKSLVR